MGGIWTGGSASSWRLQTGLMHNQLFSRILNIMWVWVPKSMCSTVRTLWIDLHKIMNPFIELEAPNMSIHKLHLMERFRMRPDDQASEIIVIVRNPIDRFVSTFLDKHVRMRQWHYTDTHNYRVFRIWLDVNCLEHTMASFLLFIETHGHIDVHDLPQADQIGNLPKRAHVILQDDNALDRARMILEPIIMSRRNLSSETRARACGRLLEKNHVNALPRADPTPIPLSDTISIARWRDIVMAAGGFPSNQSVWATVSDDTKKRFDRVYRQDTQLYYQSD